MHLDSLPKSYFKICVTKAEPTGKMKGKSRVWHLQNVFLIEETFPAFWNFNMDYVYYISQCLATKNRFFNLSFPTLNVK